MTTYKQQITHSYTEEDMVHSGSHLAKSTVDGAVIFLYGPLGAGKTTWVRGFLRGLGYLGKVKSPTYTLVEPYEIAGEKIFHFDFYRIEKATELESIGLEEYFMQGSIYLVEWPEKGFPLLPEPDLACYIEYKDEGREIKLVAYSSRGEAILDRNQG